MEDKEFNYITAKCTGRLIDPQIYVNMGFYVDTGNDRMYLCELDRRKDGWELYIYHEHICCYLNSLSNYPENSKKISRFLKDSDDGKAIAMAIRNLCMKSKNIII